MFRPTRHKSRSSLEIALFSPAYHYIPASLESKPISSLYLRNKRRSILHNPKLTLRLLPLLITFAVAATALLPAVEQPANAALNNRDVDIADGCPPWPGNACPMGFFQVSAGFQWTTMAGPGRRADRRSDVRTVLRTVHSVRERMHRLRVLFEDKFGCGNRRGSTRLLVLSRDRTARSNVGWSPLLTSVKKGSC